MKRLVYAFMALVALAACSSNQPKVSIYSEGSFNANNKAALTLSLDQAAPGEVQVLLSGDPADKLEFASPVIIPAGNRSAGVVVTLNPEGLEPGTLITISIKDVIGAVVGTPSSVSLTPMSYGGNEQGGGGQQGDGGEDNPSGSPTLVSTWSAALDGEPYNEEDADWMDLTMSTDGIQYYGVEALFSGELEDLYGDVKGLIDSWDEYIASYLEQGYGITDILFAAGEYTYIEYPGAGEAKIYIVEFDASGKTTGRYGVSDVVFPEYESGSGSGSGELKTTISVPETFTLTSSFGAQYMGRYSDVDEETSEETFTDVFHATGTGSSFWFISVEQAGVIGSDVHGYAEGLGASLEQVYALYISYYGEDTMTQLGLDIPYLFLGDAEYDIETEAYENGQYEAVVFTFTDEGDFDGRYNIVPITIDGHEYQEPAGMPSVFLRHFPIAKGLRSVALRPVPSHKNAKNQIKICSFK